MIGQSVFFRFARRHEELGLPEFKADRPLEAGELAALREFSVESGLSFTDEEWQAALPQLELQVRYELASHAIGWKEGFRVLNAADPQVQAALKLFPHAERQAILEDAREGKVHEVVLAEVDGSRLPEVQVRTVQANAGLVTDPERDPSRLIVGPDESGTTRR
jgi:hypothetical protein